MDALELFKMRDPEGYARLSAFADSADLEISKRAVKMLIAAAETAQVLAAMPSTSPPWSGLGPIQVDSTGDGSLVFTVPKT